MSVTQEFTVADLPGANCGLCGFRTCGALAEQLEKRPDLI
jgi:Na+-translocating ferredoxin:NAD+ oxidoreductase RNF subunit RnfB